MNKYIFLDIDGVIATHLTINNDDSWGLTPECQERLGRILKKTGAKIVLSSSWRYNDLEKTITFMKSEGFNYSDDIIGVTIRAYQYLDRRYKIHLSIPRGVEIKQWIDTHVHSNNGKDYKRKTIGVDFNYVILDDETDMLLEQKDYFINTDERFGLTDNDVEKAIKILNYKATTEPASVSQSA